MGKIRQLSEDTANKIAAGEVVERPASVIKELVENSIDACAHKIDVEVVEGGATLMRIIDDGVGMSEEDAQMCFSRHATSKIVDDHDLFNITTLGFRGEAIPSIASISKFTLETCEKDVGTRVSYEFGKKKSVERCAMNKGTCITVERIFQNVPARLKYLKSVNAEFAAIYTYIERLSLAHPEIAFTLTHNNKLIYSTNGSGSLLEVIAEIYGVSTAKNMMEVDFGNEEFHISGYISKIEESRASKNHIITLVNDRYVRNMKTINTINDVYRNYLPEKRFPIAIVHIDVDPYLVDVNVHPAKLEVRFSKEMALKEVITEGIEQALKTVHETPVQEVEEKPTFKVQHEQMLFKLEEDVPSLIKMPTPTYHVEEKHEEEKEVPIKEEKPIVKKEVKPLKEKIYAKGQVRGTYLIGENEKGMYLIDQKAAQERINYEKYQEHFASSSLDIQPLTVPLIFEFTESEFMILEENKDKLEMIGINLESFSRNTFTLRSLPSWMTQIDEKHFIEDMCEKVLNDEDLDLLELRDYAIIALASKFSVDRNTYLSTAEMQAIMDQLMRCDNPYVDASGKPTLIFYSDHELLKMFKRIR